MVEDCGKMTVPRSRFVDKTGRMFRVLLTAKVKRNTWYQIAKEAEVSASYAYHLRDRLQKEGLIDDSRIVDPKGVFLEWANRKDLRLFREYHIQDPTVVLKESSIDYALTGYFAENLVGHYLFPRYYELYIRPQDAIRWHSILSERGYVGKGNVRIILDDDHVFYEREEIDGWRVVSVQQLIKDLYVTGAECTEAADLLVRRIYS